MDGASHIAARPTPQPKSRTKVLHTAPRRHATWYPRPLYYCDTRAQRVDPDEDGAARLRVSHSSTQPICSVCVWRLKHGEVSRTLEPSQIGE